MTTTTTLDLQRRLLALGYDVGKSGADGQYGGDTRRALDAALLQLATFRGAAEVIPPAVASINRDVLFDSIRRQGLFNGVLNLSQVEGIETILDGWDRSDLTDRRWLAYMLATAYHETGRTMQPVRETFAANDNEAIKILDRNLAAGKLSWVKTPYWRKDANGKSWLGRGLVQLTHEANYRTMSAILGVDLVGNPTYAMNPEIAVEIMIEGMTHGASSKGDFTGKSLETYFNATTEDWVNARRIINGIESADIVAGYGRKFHAALKAA
ncbi:hypothetical protein [Rhizobium sp. 9140]|uniref:hypothetical protein n=1 Tax=Rhizobium sp. 9140 TaxID=1761900 RepID=UPI0007935943|nr:hypothetical protein [Rhizobium sp. 9140]CZT36238.1 Chitinase class I [Rhizobium sp. 9140]